MIVIFYRYKRFIVRNFTMYGCVWQMVRRDAAAV